MSFLKKLAQKNELTPAYKVSENLSEVPIWQFNLATECDLEQVTNKIYKLAQEYPGAGSTQAKIKGWHSEMLTHKLTNEFDDIIALIKNKIIHLMMENEYPVEAMLCEPTVTESWAIIYKQGQGTSMHHHGLAAYSTVFYVKMNDDSSPLEFSNGLKLNPKSGSLLVFPGYLRHSVPESNSTTDRIVFVANYSIVPKSNVNISVDTINGNRQMKIQIDGKETVFGNQNHSY